jgi:hypothetical protein
LSNTPCQSGGVIETKIMTIMTTNQQLELGFNGTQTRILGRRRETRVARAQWWFAQMRAAVADAMDWPANGQAPAEQGVFNGVNREANV